MIGLAVGDALGTTVEFLPRGSFPPITDIIGGGPFRLNPGQWTDDTSMAICLAESLLFDPRLDPTDLMQRFARWVKDGYNSSTGKCFDIGNATLKAISKFNQDGNPFAGSTDRYDAGNGSIMRLAPVALRWWSEPETAREVSKRQGMTTHRTQEAVQCCELLSATLCAAIRDGSVACLEQAQPSHWLNNVSRIAAGVYRDKEEAEIHSSGYVIHTLEAAFWCISRTSSFRDAVLAAVNLGNDADTVGAVTGQISGAIYGYSGIPESWRNKIFDHDKLKMLSERLLDASL